MYTLSLFGKRNEVELLSNRLFVISRNNLPAEVGEDIELKGVQLQFPSARTLDKNTSLYKVIICSVNRD